MRDYCTWFMTLKKLFLVCVHTIRLSSAQTCLPSYHNVLTNHQTYEILGRKDFQPSGNYSGYFLPMVVDRQRNRLIIGAKDYIYYIDGVTLKELHAQNWQSDKHKQSSCESTLKSTDSCSNYIHFLVIYGNRLFVCGTNSLSPKYKLISLDDNFRVLDEKAAYDVCSSRRDLTMVGEMTEWGELISGSYTDFEQKNSVISGIFVMEKGRRQKLITERNVHLKQPEFVASVSVGDSVYIFLMEQAVEDDNLNTATVVRLCKGDNGGSVIIGSDKWTTFRKSRLRCEIISGGEIFIFKNLVHVVYDPVQNVFYAAYTMFKHLNMHSAVCTFKLSDVDETFSGNFLDTRMGKSVTPVSNGGFLHGCKVNSANLSRNVPAKNGKQPTNYLNRKALTKAMQYMLMEQQVSPSPDIFQLLLSGISFTRLVVMQIKYGSSPILIIGTENGKIFMVHKNGKSIPCVIKEIKTDVGLIQTLLVNEKNHTLYVGSSTKVISLAMDSCQAYASEDLCIQAHNPVCGWSSLGRKCLSIWEDENVVQLLSECPQRTDYFGQWSSWSPCEFSTEKYCVCRSRSCDSCNASYCDTGRLSEVKNCSSNPVSDVDQWLLEGSIDGAWSEWGAWSSCNDNLCGNKTMSKNRTCTSPRPSNGGKDCIGDSFQCKACPEKVLLIDTIWSGWSSWGECFKTKGGSYVMNCTRACSIPNSCPGLDTKILPCTPEGIKWGPWSACSCAQKVRHRLPLLINGCENNCTFLSSLFPQYQVCVPRTDCFTLPKPTEVITTTAEETTQQGTTKQETTTGITTLKDSSDTTTKAPTVPPADHGSVAKICTPVPLQTKDSLSIKQSMEKKVAVEELINTNQSSMEKVRNSCDNTQNKFSLQQLIIILTVVIVTCFFICALIVYLILRRTKHTEKIIINGRTTDRIPLKKGDFNPTT